MARLDQRQETPAKGRITKIIIIRVGQGDERAPARGGGIPERQGMWCGRLNRRTYRVSKDVRGRRLWLYGVLRLDVGLLFIGNERKSSTRRESRGISSEYCDF